VFLENRFFQFFAKYAVYKLIRKDAKYAEENDVYFVVSIKKYKHTNLLYVVDYRFSIQNEKEIILVLKAVAKITRKMNLSATLIRSSFEQFSTLLKRNCFIAKNPGGDIITKYPINPGNPVFVTSADADQDLPNRDDWFDYLNQN
jgi:hypothetical protein